VVVVVVVMVVTNDDLFPRNPRPRQVWDWGRGTYRKQLRVLYWTSTFPQSSLLLKIAAVLSFMAWLTTPNQYRAIDLATARNLEDVNESRWHSPPHLGLRKMAFFH